MNSGLLETTFNNRPSIHFKEGCADTLIGKCAVCKKDNLKNYFKKGKDLTIENIIKGINNNNYKSVNFRNIIICPECFKKLRLTAPNYKRRCK